MHAVSRRDFLRRGTMTIAAAQLGMGTPAQANDLGPLDRATAWLNSPPLRSADLAGKIVLVNFCTYTCINWLRTLPFVRAWAEKYKDRLTVIGAHTPELPFEHDIDNVRRAVDRLKLVYPIAVDNDYRVWQGFDNHYWPALYLIDARGRVRHRHFGEDGYEESERAIQKLLAVDEGLVSGAGAGIEAAADWGTLKSPENYLGSQRTENFSSPGGGDTRRRRLYVAPARLALNGWALAGDWDVGEQAVVSKAPQARIAYRFHARDVHLVMGPSRREQPVRVRVTLDGQPPGAAHGLDIDESGSGTVVEQRLHQLIRQPPPIVDRRLEIELLDAGVEAFSFTFG